MLPIITNKTHLGISVLFMEIFVKLLPKVMIYSEAITQLSDNYRGQWSFERSNEVEKLPTSDLISVKQDTLRSEEPLAERIKLNERLINISKETQTEQIVE